MNILLRVCPFGSLCELRIYVYLILYFFNALIHIHIDRKMIFKLYVNVS